MPLSLTLGVRLGEAVCSGPEAPLGLLRGELGGNGEHVSTRQHKEKHVSASCP